MARSKGGRIAVAIAGVVVVLVAAALASLYFVQHEVKERVVKTLGPLGSAESIDVGFSSVRLTNVRLLAPKGWPANDTLRASQIVIIPDIRDLISRHLHLRSVVVSGFEISVLHSADGRIQLLPNLRDSLNRPGSPGGDESRPPLPPEKLIDHMGFEQGTFVFYDLSVSKPAYKITVSDANATVDHIHLPDLAEPTTVAVKGSIKGPSHTGTVSFNGWMKIASRDSQTTTTLRGVDVKMLDPYLLKKASAKAQVTGGTVDMTVESTVRNYYLRAPGTVTLHHLQLADTDNPVDTFLSIPTKAAVAALKRHGDDITLHFVLEGNLRDPKFSLNESLLTKIGNGFAQAVGVSIEGVAKGTGETVKGLGNALRNLIGQ